MKWKRDLKLSWLPLVMEKLHWRPFLLCCELKCFIKFIFGQLWLKQHAVTFWWQTADWGWVCAVWTRALIEVRFPQDWTTILKAVGTSPVCKDLLMHVEMNWDEMGEQDSKRGVSTGPREQMVQLETGMMACRAKLWPQWRVEVEVDPAAGAAIYSWYISDFLNVTIHNAGLAVWNLNSAGLIRVYFLLRG